VTNAPVSSWREILEFHDELAAVPGAHWMYRGQRLSEWKIRSKLERALEDRFGESLVVAPAAQRRLLREFKRHFHRYATECPADNDDLRWLGLMQHHGAPTSLVDFSYSFYVALFFAIERANPEKCCAIWAIDHNWLWDVAKLRLPAEICKRMECDELGGKTPATIKALLDTQTDVVVPLNPFRLDERVAAQQGVFVTTPAVSRPLHNVLEGLDTPESLAVRVRRLEVQLSQPLLRDLLSRLQRMNITRVSLFPGIDGLAGSLENLLGMDHRNLADETWGGRAG
jgi:hypothetical protein